MGQFGGYHGAGVTALSPCGDGMWAATSDGACRLWHRAAGTTSDAAATAAEGCGDSPAGMRMVWEPRMDLSGPDCDPVTAVAMLPPTLKAAVTHAVTCCANDRKVRWYRVPTPSRG